MNEIAENFKNQIDFDVLERRFEDGSPVERRILGELTDLAIDVLQSKAQTYRIGREDKTRTVVESCLKKLTCENMEQTVHNIFSYDKEISDPFAFNLTALYKASLTCQTQSNAKVNSEIREENEWAEAV